MQHFTFFNKFICLFSNSILGEWEIWIINVSDGNTRKCWLSYKALGGSLIKFKRNSYITFNFHWKRKLFVFHWSLQTMCLNLIRECNVLYIRNYTQFYPIFLFFKLEQTLSLLKKNFTNKIYDSCCDIKKFTNYNW